MRATRSDTGNEEGPGIPFSFLQYLFRHEPLLTTEDEHKTEVKEEESGIRVKRMRNTTTTGRAESKQDSSFFLQDPTPPLRLFVRAPRIVGEPIRGHRETSSSPLLDVASPPHRHHHYDGHSPKYFIQMSKDTAKEREFAHSSSRRLRREVWAPAGEDEIPRLLPPSSSLPSSTPSLLFAPYYYSSLQDAGVEDYCVSYLTKRVQEESQRLLEEKRKRKRNKNWNSKRKDNVMEMEKGRGDNQNLLVPSSFSSLIPSSSPPATTTTDKNTTTIFTLKDAEEVARNLSADVQVCLNQHWRHFSFLPLSVSAPPLPPISSFPSVDAPEKSRQGWREKGREETSSLVQTQQGAFHRYPLPPSLFSSSSPPPPVASPSILQQALFSAAIPSNGPCDGGVRLSAQVVATSVEKEEEGEGGGYPCDVSPGSHPNSSLPFSSSRLSQTSSFPVTTRTVTRSPHAHHTDYAMGDTKTILREEVALPALVLVDSGEYDELEREKKIRRKSQLQKGRSIEGGVEDVEEERGMESSSRRSPNRIRRVVLQQQKRLQDLYAESEWTEAVKLLNSPGTHEASPWDDEMNEDEDEDEDKSMEEEEEEGGGKDQDNEKGGFCLGSRGGGGTTLSTSITTVRRRTGTLNEGNTFIADTGDKLRKVEEEEGRESTVGERGLLSYLFPLRRSLQDGQDGGWVGHFSSPDMRYTPYPLLRFLLYDINNFSAPSSFCSYCSSSSSDPSLACSQEDMKASRRAPPHDGEEEDETPTTIRGGEVVAAVRASQYWKGSITQEPVCYAGPSSTFSPALFLASPLLRTTTRLWEKEGSRLRLHVAYGRQGVGNAPAGGGGGAGRPSGSSTSSSLPGLPPLHMELRWLPPTDHRHELVQVANQAQLLKIAPCASFTSNPSYSLPCPAGAAGGGAVKEGGVRMEAEDAPPVPPTSLPPSVLMRLGECTLRIHQLHFSSPHWSFFVQLSKNTVGMSSSATSHAASTSFSSSSPPPPSFSLYPPPHPNNSNNSDTSFSSPPPTGTSSRRTFHLAPLNDTRGSGEENKTADAQKENNVEVTVEEDRGRPHQLVGTSTRSGMKREEESTGDISVTSCSPGLHVSLPRFSYTSSSVLPCKEKSEEIAHKEATMYLGPIPTACFSTSFLTPPSSPCATAMDVGVNVEEDVRPSSTLPPLGRTSPSPPASLPVLPSAAASASSVTPSGLIDAGGAMDTRKRDREGTLPPSPPPFPSTATTIREGEIFSLYVACRHVFLSQPAHHRLHPRPSPPSLRLSREETAQSLVLWRRWREDSSSSSFVLFLFSLHRLVLGAVLTPVRLVGRLCRARLVEAKVENECGVGVGLAVSKERRGGVGKCAEEWGGGGGGGREMRSQRGGGARSEEEGAGPRGEGRHDEEHAWPGGRHPTARMSWRAPCGKMMEATHARWSSSTATATSLTSAQRIDRQTEEMRILKGLRKTEREARRHHLPRTHLPSATTTAATSSASSAFYLSSALPEEMPTTTTTMSNSGYSSSILAVGGRGDVGGTDPLLLSLSKSSELPSECRRGVSPHTSEKVPQDGRRQEPQRQEIAPSPSPPNYSFANVSLWLPEEEIDETKKKGITQKMTGMLPRWCWLYTPHTNHPHRYHQHNINSNTNNSPGGCGVFLKAQSHGSGLWSLWHHRCWLTLREESGLLCSSHPSSSSFSLPHTSKGGSRRTSVGNSFSSPSPAPSSSSSFLLSHDVLTVSHFLSFPAREIRGWWYTGNEEGCWQCPSAKWFAVLSAELSATPPHSFSGASSASSPSRRWHWSLFMNIGWMSDTLFSLQRFRLLFSTSTISDVLLPSNLSFALPAGHSRYSSISSEKPKPLRPPPPLGARSTSVIPGSKEGSLRKSGVTGSGNHSLALAPSSSVHAGSLFQSIWPKASLGFSIVFPSPKCVLDAFNNVSALQQELMFSWSIESFSPFQLKARGRADQVGPVWRKGPHEFFEHCRIGVTWKW